MLHTHLLAVAALTAVVVAPASDSLAGQAAPTDQPSAPAASTQADFWSAAQASGSEDFELQTIWWKIFQARQAKGLVTVSASALQTSPVTEVATISTAAGSDELLADDESVLLKADKAIITITQRTDSDGKKWSDLKVSTVADPVQGALTDTNVSAPVKPAPEPEPTPEPTPEQPVDPQPEPEQPEPDPAPNPGGGGDTPVPDPGTGGGDIVVPPAPGGGAEVVVPITPPVVDITPEQAVDTVATQVQPTTVVTMADGSITSTRSWTTPDGQEVTQITTRPSERPSEELSQSRADAPVAASPTPSKTPSAKADGPKEDIRVKADGKEVAAPVSSENEEQPRSIWPIIGVGAGSLSIIGGAIFAIARKRNDDEEDEDWRGLS